MCFPIRLSPQICDYNWSEKALLLEIIFDPKFSREFR